MTMDHLDVEPEIVTLRDGPTLPLDVILFALDLEARGITLHVDGDSLWASPERLITLDDAARIGDCQEELVAIVKYCEASVVM